MTEFETIKQALEREGYDFELFTYGDRSKVIRVKDFDLDFRPDDSLESVSNMRYAGY